MGIKPNFNLNAIKKQLDAVQQRVDNAIVQALKRLGEMCVAKAREDGDYIDQTGNLRSSIGFLVLDNGQIVENVFAQANKDENGKGVNTGRSYAEDISKEYKKGYVLIVVAGMSYAAAVESKNKDVLTSAEMYAGKRLPGMLEQLKKNIDKMKA